MLQLPIFDILVELIHFIEGEAKGDVWVEVDDDGFDAVRRDVKFRTCYSRTPEIGRSFVLEEI